MATEQEITVKVLRLLRNCVYHLTIGKEGYNYSDIEEMDRRIDELEELEKEPK